MNQDRLVELLRGSTDRSAEPTPDCPNRDRYVALFEGNVGDGERQQLNDHLSGCGCCLNRVGSLVRTHRSSKVRDIRSNRTNDGSTFTFVPPRWAAAAVVVIAVALGGVWQLERSYVMDLDFTSETRGPRFVTDERRAPRILIPEAASTIDRESLVFRWTDIPGSMYYELRIVSDEGDLIHKRRVADTHWAVDASVPLVPGREYYVRIDAYLSEARAISSDHVRFTVKSD